MKSHTHTLFPVSVCYQDEFGLLPRRKPVFIVIGKPIHVEKVEGAPTTEQLQELLTIFTQAEDSLRLSAHPRFVMETAAVRATRLMHRQESGAARPAQVASAPSRHCLKCHAAYRFILKSFFCSSLIREDSAFADLI